MSHPIFVSGATGNIGFEVVKSLSQSRIPVRAGVHSLKKAGPLKELGAEVVLVDFNDSQSIIAALDGVEKAFSLSPLVPNIVELGINFVKSAKKAGVKYIVRSSGLGADSPSAITLGRWHREVEQALETSGMAYTLIRPNSFMQNYVTYSSHTIQSQNAFYLPQGTGRISLIDVRDIAAIVATLLTGKGYEGKAYNLTGGEAISNTQIADRLSKVTGRNIQYVDVPEEAARKSMQATGMPDVIGEALLELSAIVKAGYTSEVSPSVEKILGRKPIRFEQFANDFSQMFK